MKKIIYSCGHIKEEMGENEIINKKSICPDCKLERTLLGKRMAKDLELPELLGTDSQIESAEGVRLNWITLLLSIDNLEINPKEKEKLKTTLYNTLKNIISASWYVEKHAYKEKGILKYCLDNLMLSKVSWKTINSEKSNDKYAVIYYRYTQGSSTIYFKGAKDEEMKAYLNEHNFTWINNKQFLIFESEDHFAMEKEFSNLVQKAAALGFKIYYEKSCENVL